MAKNPSQSRKLIGDMPIFEAIRQGAASDGTGPDKLNFDRTAQVLADAAVESNQPINFGIYGRWGTGKTSLMRLMMEKVRDPKRTTPAIPVWFNAWQYEREEHLIVPLIATINREIGLEIARWEEGLPKLGKAKRETVVAIVDGAKKLGAALRSVAYGFAIKGKVGIPMMAEGEVSLSGKDMVDRYQELTKDAVLSQSLYFDAFEKLQEITKSGGSTQPPFPRIVVFVDDLDRCFPDNAVKLLEGIKLVLHQPGFSFVLGVNDGVIREFVKTKYTREYNVAIHEVDVNYLEKIVQVEVPVPERAPDAMAAYIESLLADAGMLEEFSLNQKGDRDTLFGAIAIAARKNPREIVRKLNRLILAWRLREKEGIRLQNLFLAVIAPQELTERLDYVIDVGGEKKPIAEFLVSHIESLEEVPEADFATRLKDGISSWESSIADKAIPDLSAQTNAFLLLLRTDWGKEWVRNKELRSELAGIAKVASTDHESQAGPVKSPKDVKDAIRKIERNMVDIPAGTFTMGEGNDRVEVTLSPFKMSKYQVTQEIYEAIMGNNPSHFKGPRNPVECVSWHDAKEFCERLSSLTGKKWRLPTEAEWEYACRAGSESAYYFGDNEAELGDYAWYDENSDGKTHPVGEKGEEKANGWGLHDMHGNVWEWCADWYGESLPGGTDPTGPPSVSYRVLRGGGWGGTAQGCRSAGRAWSSPSYRDYDYGFRPVLAVQ